MRRVAEYRHKVTLCRARDQVVGQDIFVARDEIFTANASIVAVRGSYFLNGFAVDEGRNLYSHNVFLRVDPKYDITGSAWVFERRVKTPSRWYKVLSVQDSKEDGYEWRLLCRLVQKSDDIAPTQLEDRIHRLPEGIRL